MAYKPKKRESILRAAAEVFSQQGYHAATTADIAVKAGIPPGSIYYHISTKEQLLFDVLMDGVDVGLKIIEDALEADTNPSTQLRTVITRTIRANCDTDQPGLSLNFAFVEPHVLEPEHWESYVEARHRYEQSIRKLVEDGVAAGVFQTTDVALETKLILSVLNWVKVWFKQTGTLSSEEVGHWYADRLLNQTLVRSTALGRTSAKTNGRARTLASGRRRPTRS
jgi:AcrR family transcriptional regulator